MKFKSDIIAIGKEALELMEVGKFIFFGEQAYYGLEDYSIIIHTPKENVSIQVGDHITIGETTYPVTAVGEKVEETFSNLGHCTVCMDGAEKAEMPGTVHLKGEFPNFSIGKAIIIE